VNRESLQPLGAVCERGGGRLRGAWMRGAGRFAVAGPTGRPSSAQASGLGIAAKQRAAAPNGAKLQAWAAHRDALFRPGRADDRLREPVTLGSDSLVAGLTKVAASRHAPQTIAPGRRPRRGFLLFPPGQTIIASACGRCGRYVLKSQA